MNDMKIAYRTLLMSYFISLARVTCISKRITLF
jgi:hypothetical protein